MERKNENGFETNSELANQYQELQQRFYDYKIYVAALEEANLTLLWENRMLKYGPPELMEA